MRQEAHEPVELVIALPSGNTLCCGPGGEHQWGGYLRICNPEGQELLYWTMEEWRDNPEGCIGAVFSAALNPDLEIPPRQPL